MVLESLLSAKEVESNPIKMFVYSVIVTTISLWTSYFIFPSASSVVFLFLITIASAPLLYKVLRKEEESEELNKKIDASFLIRNKQILTIYLFLFIGVLISSTLWYAVLPSHYTSLMFSYQMPIEKALTGSSSGAFYSESSLIAILSNNLEVALIAFIVSLLFGAGAVFILSWNASVIAVFIGNLAKDVALHSSPLQGVLVAIPKGLLSISLHGIPEISAYSLACISGGVLSAGLIRRHETDIVVRDSIVLLTVALVLVFVGGFIEAFLV